jgi:hypothetical protein
MRVGSQNHDPAALFQGKGSRYPSYRRLGGPHVESGRVRKIYSPPGFDPRTFQPVASRFTDWAIPAYFFQETYFDITTNYPSSVTTRKLLSAELI